VAKTREDLLYQQTSRAVPLALAVEDETEQALPVAQRLIKVVIA